MLGYNLPHASTILGESRKLLLHPEDPVDAVDEQNQDEDKGDLLPVNNATHQIMPADHTFKPYCNFAMIGLSEMKAKSLRLMVNGRGTMRARKTAISKTKRRKTYS